MVKILHTADWHIGQTLAGFGREAEHRTALAQLVDLAAEEAVDAVIVAGDVFDTLNPSAEAQRLYFDTLVAFRRARPQAPIVVVAGNHDPAGRLEAPRELFALANLHVVGTIARAGNAYDLARHLVPVRDATGAVAAQILAVPFPRVRRPAAPRRRRRRRGLAGRRGRAWALPRDDRTGESRDRRHAPRRHRPPARRGRARIRRGGAAHPGGRRARRAARDLPPRRPPTSRSGTCTSHSASAATRSATPGSLFPLSKTESGYDHGATLVTIEGCAVRAEHRPLPRLGRRGSARPPERGRARGRGRRRASRRL